MEDGLKQAWVPWDALAAISSYTAFFLLLFGNLFFSFFFLTFSVSCFPHSSNEQEHPQLFYFTE